MKVTPQLDIISNTVSLRGLQPVLNGAPLEGCDAQYSDGEYRAVFTKDNVIFTVEITPQPHGCTLRYAAAGLPDDFVLDSFGIRFSELSNVRAFLRMGYYSWDSSDYVEPEKAEKKIVQGYAVTQLLPYEGDFNSLVLGFDRHDRFQQTFTLDATKVPYSLMIETWWDRKSQKGLTRCESEQLSIIDLEVSHHEIGLRDWAKVVGETMNARRSVPPINGWSSWYSLYASITEENILEHLRGVKVVKQRENLPMWVFQIDDGFTPEMGDWLEVKPQFPRGMKPLLDDIREAGFTPGLWIAPFMVGNRSKLYQEHPDWVVVERATGKPLPLMRLYGEFRWHKRSEEYYTLDTTHPDALEYLRKVFRIWRQEWGCDYFKTDFMHFGSEHTPDKAKWHQDGLTRIEIWRQACEMMREEMGDAVWLGCGCPLWASVGLVDGMRIAGDVGVEWQGGTKAHGLLRNQMLRGFAHGNLWQADPDCILLRETFHHLSDAEIRSLAIYAGMTGGVVMTSDALDEFSDERLRLWKLILNSNQPSHCTYPLLGKNPDDPVIVQVRGSLDKGHSAAVFVFNTGHETVQRSYPFALLLSSSDLYGYDWTTGTRYPDRMKQIDLVLPPHDGRLLFFSLEPFTEVPEVLP